MHPAPATSDLAQACLQASHLLRRHTRRQLHLPAHDERTAQATCRLLETLSLALAENPECLPRQVAGAAHRLARSIAALPPIPYPTPSAARVRPVADPHR
ncbi:hypothetical protein [Pseudonocardia asaccharolytica]|uniref:Uncharacterized protein n=1 Tax=Pseudonocardia asaccharolytica DSM 44247 = NBRC 16224 TaxID=1123024 RepID=A0A511CX20_9PSEU|nr:hypothetical protein [Pseudonocardia asaccharolytica]GEL17110.1 hypothetical protein PA7_09470 [Pseudonocardia asaccharolytica DSM 44247 = NBRC 16224]